MICMIKARSLVKDFDGFRALDGISFDLSEPGIFGIIGHNGAGKTTLLKIMAGLMQPTSGELTIGGVNVVENPDVLKARLGYLPEESRLYETMTVESYLTFFGEIYGLNADTIRERRISLLSSLALEDNGKKIGELSKGMRRKVAIARSLIHDPDILIYDEPTSGLDPMTSLYISGYLRELGSEGGKTILISAHNLHQVEEICDRVMILRRGKSVAFGTMDELREVFGSIKYEIYFVIENPSSLVGLSGYREESGLFITIVHDVAALNLVTAEIAERQGSVKKIESRYPSLEEMLIRIGK